MTAERYRLPDPKCKHKRRGRVVAGDPEGVFASTDVCDRPGCIEDAQRWAEAEARQPARHLPDSPRKRSWVQLTFDDARR